MATIKDIAALAGVSRGTVDRVLNNRGSVNPAKEIEAIIKRLQTKQSRAGTCRSKKEAEARCHSVLHGQPFFC